MITREQYTKQQSIISGMMTICDEDRAKAFIGKKCYFANGHNFLYVLPCDFM